MTDQHFGNWLKREIEKRLLLQAEFAKAVEVPLATLRSWLANPRPAIRGVNRERLARALEMSRDDLESILNTGPPLRSA